MTLNMRVIFEKKNFFALRALDFFKKISPCGEFNVFGYYLFFVLISFSTGFLTGRRIANIVCIFSGVRSVGRQRTRAWMLSAIGAIFGE